MIYFISTILINTFINGNQFLNNSLVIMYKYLLLIPSQYICSIYLLYNSRIINKSSEYLYSILVKAGVIQGILATIAFVSPSVKNVFVNIMASNTGSDIFFQQTVYSSASDFRFFGFSRTLLDTFGFGMGILCVLALHLHWNYKRKYIFSLPFLLISILLNSRSGILVFLVGISVYFILSMKNISVKKIIGFVVSLFFIIISFKPIMSLVGKYSPNTVVWIQSGFNNLFSFVLGNEKKSFEVSDVLFSKQFWTFPDKTSDIIFGSGHDVYLMKNIMGIHSDVGYVNQFWVGGIVGSFLLISMLGIVFIVSRKNIMKNSSESIKILYALYAVLLVMNIKADVISYNPGTIICICLISDFLFLSDKTELSN